MITMKAYKRAAEAVEQAIGTAEIALVLGSGLGGYDETMEDRRSIDYQDVPGFPVSTVPGHAGRFVSGLLKGKRVIMMCGRFHSYEGYSMAKVTMPVRVLQLMGVKTLILTNAAGGANEGFQAGDLMLLSDFINFSGKNPLRGQNMDAFGPRFPDMTNAYAPEIREVAREVARELQIPLKEGVYAWFNGPTYETPAEVRMAQALGADAVGMSTVPETIVARHAGMKVVGISAITNLAAGMTGKPISHDEVMEAGRMVRERFARLMDGLIEML